MTDHSEPGYDRRLLLLASATGMAAIVALPLTRTGLLGAAPVLVFALPVMLAFIGRMRGTPWLTGLALVLLVLLAAALLLPVGPLGLLLPATILAGPPVAVIAVGMPLRDVDISAAAWFLLTGLAAVIGGFAAADVRGSPMMVVGVALIGVTAVAFRLGRRPPA